MEGLANSFQTRVTRPRFEDPSSQFTAPGFRFVSFELSFRNFCSELITLECRQEYFDLIGNILKYLTVLGIDI